MRETLLTINAVWFLFGATIYCGVMWALRFFFYPSWSAMNTESVKDHFLVPIAAATRFFWVVVPLMLISGLVMVITAWGDAPAFVAALIALAGIIAIPAVGVVLIFPVNRIIKDGVADDAALVPLLQKWMRLNNIRWILATIMWGAAVWYIIAIGDFPHAV